MMKEMICIVCPLSCHLEADLDDKGAVLTVRGNSCPRGEVYARKELTFPTRMLTTTVKIKGAMYERLPVITSSEIPKGKMFDVMNAVANIEMQAPVVINQVILKDVCGLGVDVLASRTMECEQ